MTLTIGAQALGSAWRKMIRAARHALEPRHLDVGAGQQVDDRGAGHAHHVGDDHQRQGQRRQGAALRGARASACRRETLESEGKIGTCTARNSIRM